MAARPFASFLESFRSRSVLEMGFVPSAKGFSLIAFLLFVQLARRCSPFAYSYPSPRREFCLENKKRLRELKNTPKKNVIAFRSGNAWLRAASALISRDISGNAWRAQQQSCRNMCSSILFPCMQASSARNGIIRNGSFCVQLTPFFAIDGGFARHLFTLAGI